MIACLQREMIMSKKHSNNQYVSARAMTPEELVRRQNQEVNEMLEQYNPVDGHYAEKHKSSKGVLMPGVGLAGARLSSRPVRLSDEEPMTAAELELLKGATPSALSKLPDDFGYTVQPRYGALAKGPAFVAASQHFIKKNGAMPSNTDKLLEKADLLIEQMAIQNEALTSMVRLFTDYFLESQDCGNIFYAVAPDQITDGEDK